MACATLPSNHRVSPVRPWEPTTIQIGTPFVRLVDDRGAWVTLPHGCFRR